VKHRIVYDLEAREVDRRIRKAAEAVKRDETVLAFYLKELKERKLYRELGYSSAVHYAAVACGFSDRKARYLLYIGERLERFRKVREAFLAGRIGWTKVRELLKIVSPRTEEELLTRAVDLTNRELEALVALKKRERAREKRDSLAAGSIAFDKSASESGIYPAGLLNGASASDAAKSLHMGGGEISPNGVIHCGARGNARRQREWHLEKSIAVSATEPEHVFRNGAVREEIPKLGVTLRFTPEEHVLFTRFLVEWKKRNPGAGKREEILIQLVRNFMDDIQSGRSDPEPGNADSTVTVVESPYEVVIHQCPECRRGRIVTDRGEKDAPKSLVEQALCDGTVYEQAGTASGHNGNGGKRGFSVEPGSLPGRKRKLVTAALRKRIFQRDRGRCTTPGCPHTKYLEVHHIVPLSKGGSNEPSNLTTSCSRCHKNIHLGKLKVRGAYPTVEFFHAAPDGGEIPFGEAASYRQRKKAQDTRERATAFFQQHQSKNSSLLHDPVPGAF